MRQSTFEDALRRILAILRDPKPRSPNTIMHEIERTAATAIEEADNDRRTPDHR